MIRILTCIVLATAAWLAMPAPAQAAESYDNCTGFINSLPATISTQGTWCLNKDLTTGIVSNQAIAILTNNVTIDCNHFKIGGLAAGSSTQATGIYAGVKLNVTVRNCNIRGFVTGVWFNGGSGHLVEDNSFNGNTMYGMLVSSFASTIRNNLVVDTGGSTVFTNDPIGIEAGGGVDILHNTIDGVVATGTDAHAYGIHSSYNGKGSVNGNRIRGLVPTGTGTPFGIYDAGPGRVVIRGNDVQGPGPSVATGVGIYCSSNTATTRDNIIAGFETGIENCFSSSDVVNQN